VNWLDCTVNPDALLAHFEQAPSLDKVVFHSLSFRRDGPTAELVFDLSSFPTFPHSRWPAGANTCQLTLSAVYLQVVSVQSWGTGVVGKLAICGRNGHVELSFRGDASFQLECSHLYFAKVSGYINGDGRLNNGF
jgi:hypothetical protein